MLKRLFSYFKEHKKSAILAVIFISLETVLEIVVPFLMSILMDQGLAYDYDLEMFTSANYWIIYGVGSAMVFCAILGFVFGILSSRYTAIAGNGLAANLREEEYKKIQSYSFDNLNKFTNSSLITRLTNDITTIQTCVCNSSRAAIRAPLMMVFAISFSFIMSWQMAIIFVVVMPILGFLLFLILSKIKPIYAKIQQVLDKLNRKIQENVMGIKTIKSYVKEDDEIDRFSNVNFELKSTSIKGFSFNALNMPTMQLVLYTTICLLLYFGGILHSIGEIEPGTITSFLAYVMQTLNSLIMLSNVFMLFSRSQASMKRVIDVLDEKPTIIDKASDLRLTNYEICFQNVCFKYESSSINVLNDISFTIKEGETIGIIGQTGSSKSTLAYLLERFYDPSSGVILIGNHDIKDYSISQLRKNISMVPQNNVLFSGTVLENLRWGNKNADINECIEFSKIACCYDFIMNKLDKGFDSYIGQGGSNVSGGQRQRLCIARALLKKPKILILDDSTSALDRITETKLKNNLRFKLKNMTKIIISQKISSIIDADKIIVMNDGKISNIGTHDYLLENDEIYADIFKLQKEAGNL